VWRNQSIVKKVTLVNLIVVIPYQAVKKHTYASKEQINVKFLFVTPLDVKKRSLLVHHLIDALLVLVTLHLELVLILLFHATMEMLVQLIVVIPLPEPVSLYHWTVLLPTNVLLVSVLMEPVPLLLNHVMMESIVLLIVVILVKAVRMSLIIPIVNP
jgi:hypothetical protein